MGIRSTDLNLLRVFLAVYQNGGVTQAMDQLHLTQPAISNALTRLNTALNCRLFVRQGRQLKPTADAHRLYEKVAGPYTQIVSTLQDFDQFDPSTSTRLFSVSLSNYFDHLMPQLANTIGKIAPGIRLHRVPYNLEQNLKRIEEGTLDLMLVAVNRLPGNFEQLELKHDEMVLAASHDHPLLKPGEKLSRKKIKRLRFASLDAAYEDAMPAYLVQYELDAMVYVRLPSFRNLVDLAVNSDYVVLLPKLLADQYRDILNSYTLPAKSTRIPLRLIWTAGADNDAGHRWFRECLNEVYWNSLNAT